MPSPPVDAADVDFCSMVDQLLLDFGSLILLILLILFLYFLLGSGYLISSNRRFVVE